MKDQTFPIKELQRYVRLLDRVQQAERKARRERGDLPVQQMRDEILAHLSSKYKTLSDGPEKARALHLVKIYVNSIPHEDLKLRWFEIVGSK